MELACSRSLEFKIPADRRYIPVVRRGVRSMAESVGFCREEAADVEVAVAEAVTNSVEHGSPEPEVTVLVKCYTSGDCLIVEVEDHSEAECIPACPDCVCEDPQERGRGVLMMHALMDECSDYRTDHGIGVRMAKQRAKQGS
jgi:serine/threonine-protein kinase RsbW